MKKMNPLYLFLHIPKTAGTTFRYHLEHNFEPDEILSLYVDSRYFNVHTGTYDLFQSKEEIEQYLLSLSMEQKNKIKVIYGHLVYYGLHSFFDRESRFLTFVRRPESKVVSLYNHHIDRLQFGIEGSKKQGFFFNEAPINLVKNGKIISFECWVKEYVKNNLVFNLLNSRGFIDGLAGENTSKGLMNIFSKFYFVGITENYDEDALFLYHKLGINRFYKNQNVSKKYVHNLDKQLQQRIAIKNTIDSELYELALQCNKTFKMNEKHFSTIVMYMRLKKFVFCYKLNFQKALYSVSTNLKQHSSM